MSSKEFILGLSERIGTSEEITQRIVRYINKSIGNVLENGKGLSVPPLGTFLIEKRMEKVVIDPSTQKRMLVPPQNLLKLVESGVEQQEMSSVSDVSAELARLTKLPDDVTDTIIASFLGYIQIALNNDDNLDIDGLGHFQTTKGVRSIVFTPSQEMSNLINKPFSPFVPVILNDGVFFPDIESESNQPVVAQDGGNDPKDEGMETQHQTPVEKQESEDKPATETTTAQTETTVQEQKNITEQTQTDTTEATQTDTDESTQTERVNATSSTPKARKFPLMRVASILLLLAGVGFVVGYLLGHTHGDGKETAEVITPDTTQITTKAEENNVQIDLDEANARVTYGAYRITSVDTVIVVAKTQSVKNLSAMYFGGEQMEMYIRALNGDREMVEAGDTLMIPHLELK